MLSLWTPIGALSLYPSVPVGPQLPMHWEMRFARLQIKELRIFPNSFSPSRSEPGGTEKINLNFYFHTSLWCLKRPS